MRLGTWGHGSFLTIIQSHQDIGKKTCHRDMMMEASSLRSRGVDFFVNF